jgi:hypothetical protein
LTLLVFISRLKVLAGGVLGWVANTMRRLHHHMRTF